MYGRTKRDAAKPGGDGGGDGDDKTLRMISNPMSEKQRGSWTTNPISLEDEETKRRISNAGGGGSAMLAPGAVRPAAFDQAAGDAELKESHGPAAANGVTEHECLASGRRYLVDRSTGDKRWAAEKDPPAAVRSKREPQKEEEDGDESSSSNASSGDDETSMARAAEMSISEMSADENESASAAVATVPEVKESDML